MTQIRTLIVGMSPEIGGVETFIIQIIRGMDPERFHFDLLTFCPKCAYEEELISRGCKVFHVTRRGKNPLRNYIEQKRFFSTQANKYDYIWLHLSSASDINTILMAKKFTSAKVICHSHSIYFESSGGIIRWLHMFLHKKNQPILAKNTDLFLACSRKAGQWLYGDIGKNFVIIPNGIDLSVFRFDCLKREAVRKSLFVQDKIVVGHVGRLTAVKNQAFLLEIFYAFQKRHNNSVLLIAGSGELEATLRETAKQLKIDHMVQFLGFRRDVPDLLQAFDVFMLPSFFEGLPVTLIEAQACGLPCVISDSITSDVAITKLLHFLSTDRPADIWADEIVASLNHPRDSKEYEEQLSEAGYSADSTIKLIADILGGKK